MESDSWMTRKHWAAPFLEVDFEIDRGLISETRESGCRLSTWTNGRCDSMWATSSQLSWRSSAQSLVYEFSCNFLVSSPSFMQNVLSLFRGKSLWVEFGWFFSDKSSWVTSCSTLKRSSTFSRRQVQGRIVSASSSSCMLWLTTAWVEAASIEACSEKWVCIV